MSPSNIEILASEPSPLGILCLRRRELLSQPGTVVTEITLNHELLMSSLNTVSERTLALSALNMHAGEDLKVLVGGLGLGYTAREVLTSDRVRRVDVIELLPQVIDWFDNGLVPPADDLKADSRFAVSEGDVYERLSRPPEQKYDVILIDVDHSPDEQLDDSSRSFYTEEGLAVAKKHLATDGVLAVWSCAENIPFADSLRRVFDGVRIEGVDFRNDLIGEDQTDWLFLARA